MEPWGIYMGHRMTPNGTKEFWGFADAPIPEGSRLYTRPAVPLTDEFLLSLWSGSDSPRPVIGKNKVLAFARAIEAAHKIGGAE